MVHGYLSRLDATRWQVRSGEASFRLLQGSTAVYVSFPPEDGDVLVHMQARVLEGVSTQAPIAMLAILNGSVRFGRFCFYPDEELVSLEHEFLAETLDDSEFFNALARVAATADAWDERLRDEYEFGGQVHIQTGGGEA
jgi:hypothetical protein